MNLLFFYVNCKTSLILLKNFQVHGFSRNNKTSNKKKLNMSHFGFLFMRRFKQNIGKKDGEENPRKIFLFNKPRKVVSCISSRKVQILFVLTIKVKHFHELFRFSKCSKKNIFSIDIFKKMMSHFSRREKSLPNPGATFH